jgi:SulP family sulfate permease
LHALPTVNWWAVSIAVFTILCISLWPKSWQKVPGSIAALLTASIAAAVFNLPVETIQSRFGGIPHGLPRPAFPSLSWNTIQQMFPSAITVAFLAAVESLLSAVVADGMIGGRHKSNMELVAQGVANLASPIFGGIPATGAIARTATNVKNGGRTPVAGMIHALVLLIILLAAGKLAAKIPLACLAGVLVVVSYHMSEWRSFQSMLSSPKSDIAVLLITFLLTVFIDLTVAVEVGMVLAAFLFMKQITNLTKIQIVTKELEETESEVSETYRNLPIPDGVEVYAVHGSFSFGAANKLLEVDRITEKAPQVLVLDMASVLYMDATGLHVLEQMHKNCVKAGIRLVIAGIHAQPLTVMEQADKLEAFGAKNFKGSVAQIFSEIHHSDSAKLS